MADILVVKIFKFCHEFQNSPQELLEAGAGSSVIDENKSLVLLPKQLWCSLQEQENVETLSEAGWVFSHGQSITSSCVFSSDGKLKVTCVSLPYQNVC